MNHYGTAVSLMILAMNLPGLGSAGQTLYSGPNSEALNQSLGLVAGTTGWPSGHVLTAESAILRKPSDWFFDGDSVLLDMRDRLERLNRNESSFLLQNDLIALSDFKLSAGLGGRFHDRFGITTDLVTSLKYTPVPAVGLTLVYGEPTGSFDRVLEFLESQQQLIRHEPYRTMAIVYEQVISESVRLSATGSYHMKTKSRLSTFESNENISMTPDYLGLGIKLAAKSILNLEDSRDDRGGTQIQRVVDYLAEFRLMMPIVEDKVAAGMEIPKDIGFRFKLTYRF